MPLAARERRTVFADHGLIPLRQLADELVALCRLSGGQYFSVSGVPAAQAYVFHHRIAEQHHVLKHHRIGFEQCFWVNGGDVYPAQRDFAAVNVPKARGELASGGFATARGADERCDLALLCHETHIV